MKPLKDLLNESDKKEVEEILEKARLIPGGKVNANDNKIPMLPGRKDANYGPDRLLNGAD